MSRLAACGYGGIAAAICLVAGCGVVPQKTAVTEAHFFPPAPDLPRMQFVRSFNGSTDFTPRNKLLDYLAGREEAPRYEIVKPFSVAAQKGRIYVTDSFGPRGLSVFDLAERRFYMLGVAPGPGQLAKPINVFADAEGFKYVSDLARRQVIVYGPDDGFVRTYGDGKTFKPIACVAHGDEVFVLDADYNESPAADDPAERIQVRRDQIVVLDKTTGKALRRIGAHGTGNAGMNRASFMAVDRRGDLYVVDTFNHRILKMDARGRVLASFGRHGDQPGDFVTTKGVAVDREGLIYAVDVGFQTVQVFDNDGTPLFAFGGPRAPEGPMDLPAGIWVDYQNLEYFRDWIAPDFKAEYLVLVANQGSRKHRVAVYARGTREGLEYPAEDAVTRLGDAGERKVLWELPVTVLEAERARP